QLLAGDYVALFFKTHMAGYRQLPLRESEVQIIREHGGSTLAQAHIAFGLEFAFLMTLQPVGFDKHRRGFVAALGIWNQPQLSSQLEPRFVGSGAAGKETDQQDDRRDET